MSEIRVNNLSNESNTGGPTISGITTFSSPYFFVPPSGNTADRPINAEKGSIRYNTERGVLSVLSALRVVHSAASHGVMDDLADLNQSEVLKV